MKRVLITGGKGGLGRALVDEFERNGWLVDAPGHEMLDVTNKEAVDAWCDSEEAYDLVIANAGVVRDKLFLRLAEADWDHVLDVNLTSAVYTARAAVARMRNVSRKGQVLFIGSYAGMHPGMGQCSYATSKAALIGATKALAQEWGPHGIRVNLVCPGFMETRMTEALSESARQSALDKHVLGAFTTPTHTARFIYFLQTEMPMVSGQVFSLDSRIL